MKLARLGSATLAIFGVPPIKPLRGVPAGACARLRLRAERIGVVFVRTPDGLTQHYLEDHGDYWSPGPIIAQNKRLT